MTDVSQPADLGGADGTPKFRSGARGIIFIIGEISSRLLSAVTLIILSALTLPTLIYSVGESNNRVAAETFTAEQLARTREQIAQQMPKMIGGSSVSSDDVNQASVQVRMQILQTQENYLEALQLDLKAVSFAGSFENRSPIRPRKLRTCRS